MNVILIAFRPDGSRREARVKGNRMLVGRLQDADLQIPVSAVSRKHCEVTLTGDAVRVRDLGSSNGTFVNGTRVVESSLKAGDTLTVGPATFVIQIDGNPMSITPDMAQPKIKAASGAPVARPTSAPGPGTRGAAPVTAEGSSMMAALPSFGDDSGEITAPIQNTPAPKTAKIGAKAEKRAQAEDEKPAGADPLSNMISKSKTSDDSSVFEFDFFDEDEEDKR